VIAIDAPIIQRTEDHRYYYQGVAYPSVTTILKVLDKSDALIPWAAKQTAIHAVELHQSGVLAGLLESIGEAGAIKALADRSSWVRDEAARIGTQIHAYADDLVNGRQMPVDDPKIVKRVELYAEWWQASGWRLRLSEAYVVHPTAKYAGTFDLLAYDADGKTVLADVKTGRGVYSEAALQLAAYSMAPLVARPSDTHTWPMPSVDRHVILHVTDAGVREVEVPVGGPEELAFIAACDLAAWRNATKGRRL
jgi:hypothetical protein